MNGKTYHQQVSYCGKSRCKRCREGIGHGPYWYAYQTVNGRTTRTYIGKHLPPEAQAEMLGVEPSAVAESSDREQVIRIYTLGQFRLERRDPQDPLDWQPVTDASWHQQRVRALLGCLVSVSGPNSASGRKLGREQIMDALWPDQDIENAGNRLDRSVYSLRQVFEPHRARPATSPLLLTERDLIVLADHPTVWIDADIFEQKIVQAHAPHLADDPGQREHLLKEAVALYGSEFLPEDQNTWAKARRQALQRSWIGLLLELADLMIKRNDLTGAIDPLDKLIAVDSANEAGAQRLMIVLEQLGRRGEAMRMFKNLARELQRQYNIAPLPETRQIYENLRKGGEHGGASEMVVGGVGVVRAGRESTGVEVAPVMQIGRSHQSPLVGRQQELEQLRALVQAAEHTARFKLGIQRRSAVSSLDPNRCPQCILLMGEVGIGKTRLAEELGREVKKRSWAVAWSRVYAQEGTIPYRLWIEVMRKAMEQGVWQRQEVTRRPLVFQPLGALLPELYHNKILPPVEIPVSLSPEQEQLRLWEAARELLSLISESTPLLIVLDDLQWADSSSCELLAYLARRTYGYPIVLVGTCRENELPQNHPLRPLLTDLRRENVVETIALDRLSDEHISSLVGHVSHAPEPVVQQISSRAAGNPFFAEELARIEEFIDDNNAPLPDTITAVLTLRLGRLSQKCLRLLQKAAVLGGSFEFQVISAMEASIPDYDEDTILELLEEALGSGMLTEEGTGTRITYQFWHPLLATHLYENLSAARRANLHRKAAGVMRQLYKHHEEEYAAVILNHLEKGGADEEQIAYYAELAGNRDCELSSFLEAEKHYRIALDNLVQYPQTDRSMSKSFVLPPALADMSDFTTHIPKRLSDFPPGMKHHDWARLSFLLERLGELASIRGEFEEARGLYSRALDLVLTHGSKESSQYQQEAQVIAMLLCLTAMTWYRQGDVQQSRNYIDRGEIVLSKANVVGGPVWASLKLQLCHACWREGDYVETRKVANEALEMFNSLIEENKVEAAKDNYLSLAKRSLSSNVVDIGRIYTLLGITEASTGKCSDALSLLNKALAIAEQYNDQQGMAIICLNMGDTYTRTANYMQAQASLRQARSLAEHIEGKPIMLLVLCNMGVLDIRTGNLAEAIDELKEAVLLAEKVKALSSVSVCNAYLSLAFLEKGNISEARMSLCKALMVSRSLNIYPYIGLSLVTIGYLRYLQARCLLCEPSKDSVLLSRALNTLKRAVKMNGIEEETRVEGKILLSQIYMMQGDITVSQEYLEQAIENAKKFELNWLITRAYHIKGNMFCAKKDYVNAKQFYMQALQMAKASDMRLEMARIYQDFGIFLLQEEAPTLSERRDAHEYLKEAYQIFRDCGAEFDMRLAKEEHEVQNMFVDNKTS